MAGKGGGFGSPPPSRVAMVETVERAAQIVAGASVEFTGIRNTDKGERRTKYSEAEPNNWSSRFVSRSRGLADE